jgi:hypothetical protein
MISNRIIGEALLQNEKVVSCVFLGKGIFLLRMEGDSLPMKTNSYGVMQIVDPERFNKEFSPRNFVVGMDELEAAADAESEYVFGAAADTEFQWVKDEQFCLEPPVRVAEEWDESIEIELDSIGELETVEDFANSWEEVISE